MASVDGTRADTYRVNVHVENMRSGNLNNLGVFDKMTGGGLDSDETKYKPGGMVPPVSLGGSKTTDNVVVSRLYRLARDHDIVQMLFNGVGKAKMVITKQPLDADGNVYGKPIVYNGTLKRCTPPEHDSESSAAALIELEMTPEGEPVAA